MIQVKNNEIVIQGGDSLFFGIGAVALFMSGIGVYYTFCCISSLIEEFNYVDLSGLIFMLFWTAAVMSMAIYGFRTSIKKVTVNSEGVSIQILFIKNHYYWSEIKDFGLSYSGSTRGGRHYYDLYFAKEKQKTKNKYKKKLKGKMIRTYIFEEDYYRAVREVLDFCKKKTSIEPFVSVEKTCF